MGGEKPKFLRKVGQEFLLTRLIRQLSPLVSDFFLVLSPKTPQPEIPTGDRALHLLTQDSPKGVAHAVWQAGNLVSGPFLVAMPDNFLVRSPAPILQGWRRERTDGALLVEPFRNGSAAIVERGRVVRTSKSQELQSPLQSAGMMILPQAAFDYTSGLSPNPETGEYELEDWINVLIEEGFEIEALQSQVKRLNVNRPRDLRQAEELNRQAAKPRE